jgi:hypothetical protein
MPIFNRPHKSFHHIVVKKTLPLMHYLIELLESPAICNIYRVKTCQKNSAEKSGNIRIMKTLHGFQEELTKKVTAQNPLRSL